MATVSSAQVHTSTRPRKKRVFILALLAIPLLLVIAASVGWVWFYSTAKSALPQLDGEIKVVGLSAPVTVLRDAQGMPTVNASTIDDMLFAQGYVTAQDRLWQMDIN